MLLCVVKVFRRCWQTSDGPLVVRAGSYEAMRVPARVERWSADRSKDSRVGVRQLSGQTTARVLRLAEGEVSVGLACDVTLEDAHDLALGLSRRGATRDVGAGARVGTHAGEHDPPQRMVRLPVPAAVESIPVGLFPVVAGNGATPHRFAHAASQPTRSALSPAATNKIAAVSIPTPSSSTRLGAIACTSGASCASRRAAAVSRSRTWRPRGCQRVCVSGRGGHVVSRG